MNKKILCMLIIVSLLFTSFSYAYAAAPRPAGYVKRTTLGVEYIQKAELWKRVDYNIDAYGPDEEPTSNSAMFNARYVAYLSNELCKEYDQAILIKDATKKKAKVDEILSKEKMLYSIVVYRKAKLPAESKIKKDIKCNKFEKLGEKDGYVFYFGYDSYNDSDLVGDSKKDFKALYDDAMAIKKGIKIFKPVTSEEGIMNLKKMKFTLKDTNGKTVTESIFKNNKLTMVNIWGTYCGPCIRELPTLAQLNTELKSKEVGIIGIISDAYTSTGVDKDIVEKAKKQIAKAGVGYTNIIPDDKMKYDGVLAYLSGVPTSFFVDSKGNIVGEIRIGDGTKEEYTELINKVLAEIK